MMMLHRHQWFNYSIEPVLTIDTGGAKSPFSVYVEVCLKCKEARLKISAKQTKD